MLPEPWGKREDFRGRTGSLVLALGSMIERAVRGGKGC